MTAAPGSKPAYMLCAHGRAAAAVSPDARRLVLRLAPAHHYFFWLYCVYCGGLAALAALSLGHWPSRGALLLYSAREDGYLVRVMA